MKKQAVFLLPMMILSMYINNENLENQILFYKCIATYLYNGQGSGTPPPVALASGKKGKGRQGEYDSPCLPFNIKCARGDIPISFFRLVRKNETMMSIEFARWVQRQ